MTNKQIKKCSVEGCNKKYYAKGYCHSHYISRHLQKRQGLQKCEVDGCENKTFTKTKYCHKHKYRIDRGLSTDLSLNLRKDKWLKDKNPRWNGGVSKYKNHSLMKRNRKIRFEQVNYICEKCGSNATEKIYHKDRDNSNHELSNLMALCRGCFWDMHMEARKKGKELKR